MDVWFDSGSSWAGVVEQDPLLRYPADLYLEASAADKPSRGPGLFRCLLGQRAGGAASRDPCRKRKSSLRMIS